MDKYKIYAFDESGKNEVYETLKDSGFREQIERFLKMKESDGTSFDNADLVYKKVFYDGYNVVKAVNFKKVMQSLRRHDEIGISNDIYAIMEEINDDGSYIAIGFGGNLDGVDICGISDKIADLSNYNV